MYESGKERAEKGSSVRWITARSRLDRIVWLLGIIGLGAIIGRQIYDPTKRVLEAAVGILLVIGMWNLSTISALLFFIVAYPYPFGISLGSSNSILIIIIFNIYLLRVSLKLETFRADRAFNLPLGLIAASYILSLSNFEYGTGLGQDAFIHVTTMFTAIGLFYLVTNMVNDEKKLRLVVQVLIISIVMVMSFTTIELLFPGRAIIPSWLYSHHKVTLITKGLRMKGPFHDFELLAEFFSLSIPLMIFMAIRSRRLLMRVVYTVLLVSCLFLMLATITRGAFITLIVGLAYLTYTCRKDLDIVRIFMFAGAFAALIVVLEAFVAQHTVSGSLFDRMVKITFERGVIPSNRYIGWTQGVQRLMWHPVFGNGPALNWSKGVNLPVYPHNGYLYLADLTGFFGLFAYLLLLYRLVKTSLISAKDSIVTSSFSRGFMKVLHVWILMFMFDQLKIEYLRNSVYIYYVWIFFALIPATRNVILKEESDRLEPATPS